MGLAFSKFWERMFGKQEMRILVRLRLAGLRPREFFCVDLKFSPRNRLMRAPLPDGRSRRRW